MVNNQTAFAVALNNQIAQLENQLMRENATIEAALEPSIVNGKAVFYSPGDGYWKRRWELQNKLTAALAIRDALS